MSVIVVLGAGRPGAQKLGPEGQRRLDRAVSVYRNTQKAEKILVTDGFVADLMFAHLTQKRDIPREAVVVEDRALDTYENALYAKPLLNGDEVVLVSSEYHLPVARRIFESRGIKVRSVVPTHARASLKRKIVYGLIYLAYTLIDPKGRLLPARYIRWRRSRQLMRLTEEMDTV